MRWPTIYTIYPVVFFYLSEKIEDFQLFDSTVESWQIVNILSKYMYNDDKRKRENN